MGSTEFQVFVFLGLMVVVENKIDPFNISESHEKCPLLNRGKLPETIIDLHDRIFMFNHIIISFFFTVL